MTGGQHGEKNPSAPGVPGSGGEPVRQAEQLDPDQLRQFQQFQQYQNFLRFSAAEQQQEQQAPPTPPRDRKVPPWLKWIGKKTIGALVLILVLALGVTWAINYIFGSGEDERPASETGGGKYHTNELLSKLPYEAVRGVYAQIAQSSPGHACGMMEESIQQRFAENLGYPDCEKAVLGLHAQVSDRSEYAESIPSSVSGSSPEHTLVVSSCQFPVKGGPSLGKFTVTRVENKQWLITGHENEPTPCPPVPPNKWSPN